MSGGDHRGGVSPSAAPSSRWEGQARATRSHIKRGGRDREARVVEEADGHEAEDERPRGAPEPDVLVQDVEDSDGEDQQAQSSSSQRRSGPGHSPGGRSRSRRGVSNRCLRSGDRELPPRSGSTCPERAAAWPFQDRRHVAADGFRVPIRRARPARSRGLAAGGPAADWPAMARAEPRRATRPTRACCRVAGPGTAARLARHGPRRRLLQRRDRRRPHLHHGRHGRRPARHRARPRRRQAAVEGEGRPSLRRRVRRARAARPPSTATCVYAIGTEGDLVCVEAATGKERWRKSLVRDFGGAMMSGWRFSESPLVDGDRLVFTPGVATARPSWRSTSRRARSSGARRCPRPGPSGQRRRRLLVDRDLERRRA